MVKAVLGSKTYEVQCDGGGEFGGDQIKGNVQGWREEEHDDDDFGYQGNTQAANLTPGRGSEETEGIAGEEPARRP